jgi:hypothetical protein
MKAASTKAGNNNKRLRTCSTSCPDLSNPAAVVFSKLYPASDDVNPAALMHRSVSSQAFGAAPLDFDVRGLPRSLSGDGFALGSLYEDEDGDTDAQLRAKKYVCVCALTGLWGSGVCVLVVVVVVVCGASCCTHFAFSRPSAPVQSLLFRLCMELGPAQRWTDGWKGSRLPAPCWPS